MPKDDESNNSEVLQNKVVSPLNAKIRLPDFVQSTLRYKTQPKGKKSKSYGGPAGDFRIPRMVGTKRDPLQGAHLIKNNAYFGLSEFWQRKITFKLSE